MPATARHLRRYLRPTGLECHDHAQWVLPLRGDLQFEVGGAGGSLDLLQGAFVAPGETHDLEALGDNCCLIIDCHPGVLDDDTLEHLCRQRWLALSRDIRRQLQDIHANGVGMDPLPQLLRYFAPAGSGARLQALCMAIAATPGADWTVARMAAEVGVGGSRLHALFAREFGLSPQLGQRRTPALGQAAAVGRHCRHQRHRPARRLFRTECIDPRAAPGNRDDAAAMAVGGQ